ncbi:hypothetical protein Q6316_29670, partial [Klebsiella pneumoniae]|nr:hypothetical protein [Klebsiella pneumoniae]
MSAVTSTILVVEDDAIVRMLIVDVLEELEFSVLEAADAEEALRSRPWPSPRAPTAWCLCLDWTGCSCSIPT